MRNYQSYFDAPGNIPHFFVIGGPKCGTTSLYFWMKHHPKVHLVNKEPNFLSPDIFEARHVVGGYQGWDDYLDDVLPPAGSGMISGDFTPRYLYSDVALEILANHPQKPLVYAIIRNPIDLVFSLHGQMLRQGLESDLNFERAWRNAIQQSETGDVATVGGVGIDRRLDYPLYGKLGERVRKYSEALGRDRFKIFVLEEELKQSPDVVFGEILSDLGLDAIDIEFETQNSRYDLRSYKLQRTLIACRDRARIVHAKILRRHVSSTSWRGTGIMKVIEKFNAKKPSSHKGLNPSFRAELAAYFASDVKELKRVLSRDLSSWSDWSRL